VFLVSLFIEDEFTDTHDLGHVIDQDGQGDQETEPWLDCSADTNGSTPRWSFPGENGHLTAAWRVTPMVPLDLLLLRRFGAREPSPVDEEVKRVNGHEASQKPGDRDRRRTELNRLGQHLEADGGEKNAAGEAERERHQQRRWLAPERQKTPNGEARVAAPATARIKGKLGAMTFNEEPTSKARTSLSVAAS
jgi:hypothetical protein